MWTWKKITSWQLLGRQYSAARENISEKRLVFKLTYENEGENTFSLKGITDTDPFQENLYFQYCISLRANVPLTEKELKCLLTHCPKYKWDLN